MDGNKHLTSCLKSDVANEKASITAGQSEWLIKWQTFLEYYHV